MIDEALAMSQESGDRLYDSNLHRLRGGILLKRDLANLAQAEEAFKTALAVAKQQGARTLALLASFALARLYQAIGRLVEAYAVLKPALEGFSPTPEMPGIAKAQALLAALAEGLRRACKRSLALFASPLLEVADSGRRVGTSASRGFDPVRDTEGTTAIAQSSRPAQYEEAPATRPNRSPRN